MKKSDEEYLLVEIDNEEAKGMFLYFLLHRCTKLITPIPDVSKILTTLLEKHVETDPGIECCDYFNVDQSCFPKCRQLNIPLDRTEVSSRDMSCEDFSVVINKCRTGKEKIKNPVFRTLTKDKNED